MKIIIFPYAKTMRDGRPHPKNYPWWSELISMLEKDGHEIIQVGLAHEKPLVSDFRTNLSIPDLETLILGADTWIGVDSFGQHLGWSLGRRGLAIFGPSDPLIFGHKENVNVLRDRKYLREQQFWWWEQTEFVEESFSPPEEVYRIFVENFVKKEQA